VGTPRTPDTRAKDSDRTDICQVLDSALNEGQLSMAEHEQRVNAATKATTLGELQALVADLQPVAPFVTPSPRPRMNRTLLYAGAGALAVLVVAIGWFLMRDTGSSTSVTTSSPTAEAPHSELLTATSTTTTTTTEDVPAVVLAPPKDMHSADGMAAVIDEIRKRFGDTMGYELAFMPDEAILARADPQDDSEKLIYNFRTGWGDPSTRSRSDTDDLADLAAFDVPAAAAALQAAPDTLKIAPGDVEDTYIDIDHIADPNGPGALELLVKVTTKSGADGFIYLDGAGNIKRVEYPG
jgi:uncharacterized protein DUF1707